MKFDISDNAIGDRAVVIAAAIGLIVVAAAFIWKGHDDNRRDCRDGPAIERTGR